MTRPDLEALLAERPEQAAHRADGALADAAGDRPIVLYGAGGVGRRVLAALRAAGTTPLCFADGAARAGARPVDGLPFLPLDDAAARHGDHAVFVVTILNPRFPFATIRDSLRDAGCVCVVSWIPVAWRHADALLPYFAVDRPELVLERADGVRRAHALLDDDASRDEFTRQLAWRLTGDFDVLGTPRPVTEQYFSADVLTPLEDETFVDCGAFDGDTLTSFLAHTDGRFARFVALEPDPQNLGALRRTVDALPPALRDRVDVLPYASAARRGACACACASGAAGGRRPASPTRATSRSRPHRSTSSWPTRRRRTSRWTSRAPSRTGSPAPAASSAATARRSPSAPTTSRTLWSLPLAVNALVDGYRYRMRRYAPDCWEVVLYALPEEWPGGTA